MKTKTIAMIMAMVMIVVCMVSGTLAWLTDTTDAVQNTFTTAGIDITLIETKKPDGTVVAAGVTDWSAAMIPGYTYSKNPVVTVEEGSIDCYLFVKFEETNSPSTYLTYTSTLTTANGWTQGDGTNIPNTVWYRKVMATDGTTGGATGSKRSWNLLENDTVKVNDSLTSMPANMPSLKYTAYASQMWKSSGVEFTAAEAWTNANSTTTTPTPAPAT